MINWIPFTTSRWNAGRTRSFDCFDYALLDSLMVLKLEEKNRKYVGKNERNAEK